MALISRNQMIQEFGLTEYAPISLVEFAEWSAAQGLEAPCELVSLATQTREPLLSAILDEQNPAYAPELAAAIRAWIDVNIKGTGNHSATVKNRIEAHAKKAGFNKTAAERIATVCTPESRKKGGR